MIYQTKTIKNIEQINECQTFNINHYQWTKAYKPTAYGQMAFLENFGLLVIMTAVESNPLRRYLTDDDPVYKDSALEAFFNFNPERDERLYLNFEMNANGALLSEFGRTDSRMKLKQLTAWHASCEARIETDCWKVILRIPTELICELYKIPPLQKKDSFTCNFYKVSEDPDIEHYASFAPINSRKPNFHLPEFFGRAVIL